MSIAKSVAPDPAITVSLRSLSSAVMIPFATIWPEADQLIVDAATTLLPPGFTARYPALTVLTTVTLHDTAVAPAGTTPAVLTAPELMSRASATEIVRLLPGVNAPGDGAGVRES